MKRLRSYRLCLVWTWIIPHVFGRGVCTGLTVLATVGEVQPSLAQTSFQNLQYRWYTDEEPCKDIRRSQTLGFDDVRDKALFQNIAQIGANSYRKMSPSNRQKFGDAFGGTIINGTLGHAVKINANQLIVPFHVVMKEIKDGNGNTLGFTKGASLMGLVVQPKYESEKARLIRLPIDWDAIEDAQAMGPKSFDLDGDISLTDDWMILTFDESVLDGMSELPLVPSDPKVFEQKLADADPKDLDPELQLTALSYGKYMELDPRTGNWVESAQPGPREIANVGIKKLGTGRGGFDQNTLITDADAAGGESGRPYVGRKSAQETEGLRAIHIDGRCFPRGNCKDGLEFDLLRNSNGALLITDEIVEASKRALEAHRRKATRN